MNQFNRYEFEKEFHYEGKDLGACYQKDGTEFKVWAPTASEVILHLYSTGSEAEKDAVHLRSLEMIKGKQGVFSLRVEGELHGTYYTYEITVDGEARETADIYGKACGVNGVRSMVVDLERTNPAGWEEDRHVVYPLKEAEIWEVHIGDFSNDKASGIPEEYRGKYLAFTQENSTLNGDGVHKTCLGYLKELGVTHIHLLPAQDYASIDERTPEGSFNWGYDPLLYNVPEGSYATDSFHGATRIKEFKEMVMALHKAGLSVVMDVVYNHTYSLDSPFEKSVPGYYYRQWKDGAYSNGSACGNDTASDRSMFRKFMIDSICYWATEYHVDGFRFDLMGLHDTETMNQIREAMDSLGDYGKKMILYGEPWSAGESPLKEGVSFARKDAILNLQDGILLFNDDTRDTWKGPFNKEKVAGFVNGKSGMEEKAKRAIKGLFGEEWEAQPNFPGRVINYVSAHDNHTLWDKLVNSTFKSGLPVGVGDDRYQIKNPDLIDRNKLAALAIQFSKGVPFWQAGEEAGRTKYGEENSYNLSPQINWLDWTRMYEFEDLIDYYKGLISVRKSLEAVKDLSRESAEAIVFLQGLPGRVVAYYIGEEKEIMVILNASRRKVRIPVEGKWCVLVDKDNARISGIGEVEERVLVEAIGGCVLKRV